MNTLNDTSVVSAYSVQVESPDVLTKAAGTPSVANSQNVDNPVKSDVAKKIASTSEELNNVMVDSNAKLLQMSSSLVFEKDEGSGRNVYSLIDSESKKVIKQFPTEEFLKVSKNLKNYLESEAVNRLSTDALGNLISSNI